MSTTTIPQGSLVWPKEPFVAKIGKSTIKAFPGQSFWVTNSTVEQANTRVVMIARSGQKVGWGFRIEDVTQFFRVPQAE